MANWRDTILKHFQPKISRLTLVADPDGLLTEEGLLTAIRQRGSIRSRLMIRLRSGSLMRRNTETFGIRARIQIWW